MTGINARIGGRRVAAVLAMGGGLMLGPAFTAHTDTNDGLGLSARTSAADHVAEPVSGVVSTAADLTTLTPPAGTARG
ncbi:hypothetical protein ACFPM3_18580 [Streptomyces coeruleoprunus]|uniref:Uncharacterized protein n=1 Tax=Streptomyces coeruleoprunus TaxID=285563 RepID=A0ABV9XI60_9ACTN